MNREACLLLRLASAAFAILFWGVQISAGAPTDQRFAEGAIKVPSSGYIDSIFVSSRGDRLYFTYSTFQPNDLFNGTKSHETAPPLPDQKTMPGLEWNTDLYYVEWKGSAWSLPVNLGTNVNTVGNECCVWLNPTETEMIFYRDTFGLTELGPSGNFSAVRATRSDRWGPATPLPDQYGTIGQSSTVYRHDIHKTPSSELYLWRHDPQSLTGGQLLQGKPDGKGGWLSPAPIAGSDSVEDETQPWVSRNELELVFNRRHPITGQTSLLVMTRVAIGAPWMAPMQVPTSGFADPAGNSVWGEPTFASSEDYMLFVRFDTSRTPWKSEIMISVGTPHGGFGKPTRLNN